MPAMMMKAVRMHEYGGPRVLQYEEVPIPHIASDEVLVAVHAAAINPVDWKIRGGHLKQHLNHELPLTPGWDVSGRVERIGSHVTRFAPGDEVFGRPDIMRDGAYAEFMTVRETELAPKPRNIDHVTAAAVPLAALTAWQALFDAPPPYQSAKLRKGQRILIHGAAGGVGCFAVQLARWCGAYVIGTGSAHSRDFLQELGVDEFIDYELAPFERSVKDVDVVLDTIGSETQERSWQVLVPGGTLVSTVSPPPSDQADKHGARGAYVFVQPNPAQLAKLSELIELGAIRPIVTEVFPLEEARRAQAHSETGHARGKIVLSIRPD